MIIFYAFIFSKSINIVPVSRLEIVCHASMELDVYSMLDDKVYY